MYPKKLTALFHHGSRAISPLRKHLQKRKSNKRTINHHSQLNDHQQVFSCRKAHVHIGSTATGALCCPNSVVEVPHQHTIVKLEVFRRLVHQFLEAFCTVELHQIPIGQLSTAFNPARTRGPLEPKSSPCGRYDCHTETRTTISF